MRPKPSARGGEGGASNHGAGGDSGAGGPGGMLMYFTRSAYFWPDLRARKPGEQRADGARHGLSRAPVPAPRRTGHARKADAEGNHENAERDAQHCARAGASAPSTRCGVRAPCARIDTVFGSRRQLLRSGCSQSSSPSVMRRSISASASRRA